MTVLCIVSGENMPTAVDGSADGMTVDGGAEGEKRLWKVDFRNFVARARELGLEGSGRRVDSGMGLGNSFGSATVDGERSVSVGA